jgi:dihydrofolate synthase/folylpolyglutamate synthase
LITPISRDHEAFLGNTIESIAREKAGIIKKNCPLILSDQPQDARTVIREKAEELSVPVYEQNQHWAVVLQSGQCPEIYLPNDVAYLIPENLPLSGQHQVNNAAMAIVAADLLIDSKLDQELVSKGLLEAHWPARLQNITNSSYGSYLPKGWQLVLDGGHNRAAAETIATWVKNTKKRPVHLVVGMLANRDPVDFLEPFVGLIDSISFITIPNEANAHSAEAMRTMVPDSMAPMMRSADSLEEALDLDKSERSQSDGVVLICGSLYLAGVVLSSGEHGPKKGS